jgi:hypothetical protein
MKVQAGDSLGATCCGILAICYLSLPLTYAFLSTGEKVVGVGDPAAYYTALLQNPTPAYVLYWVTTIIGIVGVAAVLSITSLVGSTGRGWLGWTSQLAIFAFAVKALDSLRGATLIKMRALAWTQGDSATRAAIGATRLTLDYHAWFSLGAVGAWILVVSISTLHSGRFPRSLGYAGILLAIGHWIGVAGFVFESVSMLSICLVMLGILAPIWYVGIALRLWRTVTL